MEFFYIDEAEGAGTSQFNDLYLLATLIIKDEKLRAVEDDLRDLARSTFTSKSIGKSEFHGHEIYTGKGAFKGLPPQERITIVENLISIIEKHDLQVGRAEIDKRRYYGNLHPHQLAFLLLVEQIEDRLSRQSSLGVLIADENPKMEQRLVADLELFKTASTNYGWRPTKIEHVADTVHFVRSKNNRLIQLADIVCSVILHGQTDHEELIAKFIVDLRTGSTPRGTLWRQWRAEHASKKQLANLQLWERLQRRCTISKRFPN